jgi:hypothetical protein
MRHILFFLTEVFAIVSFTTMVQLVQVAAAFVSVLVGVIYIISWFQAYTRDIKKPGPEDEGVI